MFTIGGNGDGGGNGGGGGQRHTGRVSLLPTPFDAVFQCQAWVVWQPSAPKAVTETGVLDEQPLGMAP